MINDEWLMGFIEGEGHFCSTHTSKRPRFTLVQGEKAVLEKIQKYLGMGKIYLHSKVHVDKRGIKHNKSYQLTIFRLDEVRRFRKWLETKEFNSESKRKQFEEWCRKDFWGKKKRKLMGREEGSDKQRYRREYMRKYWKTHPKQYEKHLQRYRVTR